MLAQCPINDLVFCIMTPCFLVFQNFICFLQWVFEFNYFSELISILCLLIKLWFCLQVLFWHCFHQIRLTSINWLVFYIQPPFIRLLPLNIIFIFQWVIFFAHINRKLHHICRPSLCLLNLFSSFFQLILLISSFPCYIFFPTTGIDFLIFIEPTQTVLC